MELNGEIVQPTHLYLTGYRGCGKSTIATLLADKLSIPSVDTDTVVETLAGKSIAEIFAQDGEESFRDLEASVVRSLASDQQSKIIALGGGAILRDASRNWIRSSGWVVWLTASPDVLAARIAGDTATAARRPSLSKLGTLDEIRAILAKREPLYNAVSHIEYDTETASLESLADQIANEYRGWVKARQTVSERS